MRVVLAKSPRLHLSAVEQVVAANEMTWKDMQKQADKLAKKAGLRKWEDVEIRRYSKSAKPRVIRIGSEKHVIEPGDMFLALFTVHDGEDWVVLWVEGMDTTHDVSQRTWEYLDANSKWLRKDPGEPRPTSRKTVGKPAPKSAARKPTGKPPVENVNTQPKPIFNISVKNSMLPMASNEVNQPLSREAYDADRDIGCLFTMAGGAMAYLLGAGARVIQGKKQPAPYAVYIDRHGAILRSKDPVHLDKPAMDLRVMKLEGRLPYDQYVKAYMKAADHIRQTLSEAAGL